MVAFAVRRAAPIGQNSLVHYEGAGAALYTPSPPLTNQPAVQQSINQQFQTTFGPPKPTFAQNTADFLQSQGFQSVLQTGLTFYQTRVAKEEAERQRRMAEQRAQMETMLAQESIRGSQQEREIQQRMAALQEEQAKSQARLSSAMGMPGWVIPAVLVGVGALVLFLVISSRKKA